MWARVGFGILFAKVRSSEVIPVRLQSLSALSLRVTVVGRVGARA